MRGKDELVTWEMGNVHSQGGMLGSLGRWGPI